MIDLHTHSTASDGALTPKELIQAAARLGIRALALTDHDTIEGIEEARKESENLGILCIPGVELEINWEKPGTARSPSGEFHLLGIGLSNPSPELLQGIAELAESRRTRNREILDRAHERGITLDYQELLDLAGSTEQGKEPIVGRVHIATLLVQRGVASTVEQAFDRYLGSGRPLYIPKKGLAFERALGMIHSSEGIAVLAHPLSLYVSWGQMPKLAASLTEQGLDGIEAWHPNAKVSACKRLDALGRSLGLIVTAGSDYHGPIRSDRKLGFTAGDRRIEDSFLPPQFR